MPSTCLKMFIYGQCHTVFNLKESVLIFDQINGNKIEKKTHLHKDIKLLLFWAFDLSPPGISISVGTHFKLFLWFFFRMKVLVANRLSLLMDTHSVAGFTFGKCCSNLCFYLLVTWITTPLFGAVWIKYLNNFSDIWCMRGAVFIKRIWQSEHKNLSWVRMKINNILWLWKVKVSA